MPATGCSQPSELSLTDAGWRVLRQRILRRDEHGSILETPDEMFWRVARVVAEVERTYSSAEEEVKNLAESFYSMMRSLDFLPNSPTLVNAGSLHGQLAGCFVLPIEDSMESIFETLKNMALIQKTGGGTGFSFSRLRPRDDFIASTKGKSSGPVSFMRLYDYACEITREGGVRSGANMAVMQCDHPDILDFISTKVESDVLRTFNISVGATDSFMERVRRDEEYPLINPRTRGEVGRLKARMVFDAIVDCAWKTGDPGLVFLDAVNKRNPTPGIGQIEATNPCGEQPLLPYESCNLGSINVANFVAEGKIDFDRLASVVRLSVRFLDNVIDANYYPIPPILQKTRANRKIGLGLMGFADMLLTLRVPYDSAEALRIASDLMSFVSTEARRESSVLADAKGVFPSFSQSIFESQTIRLRNASVTTIAPTGTISIIANCSSGIEPLFAISYAREMLGNRVEFSMHPLFEELAAPCLDPALRERISENGSVQSFPEIPEELRRLFVTAHDISPEWHVRMQAVFQRHVDSAVSKTVNLKRQSTPSDIAKVYLLAHELGCKGITVFRDGCKQEQVLRPGRPVSAGAESCPECGGPMEHASACVTCVSCGYTLCTI